MPRIAAVATATPPHRVSQQDIKRAAREFFAAGVTNIDRYTSVFDNGEIDTRFLAAPLEWFGQHHTWGEANDLWIEVASALGAEAARRCLQDARLAPGDIDHIFFVSTTGLAAPSLDARLITLLEMPRHTRRTPIWGLGCAGGVAGLARASEYVRAFPGHRALLVCVELCSLTFQFDDRSKRNLVAASLFGDGAAAVVLEGDALGTNGPEVVATESTLFPDSLDLMGWDIVDTGMRVVFGAGIPRVVTAEYQGLATEFLGAHGLALSDIQHHIYHPGGAKVLSAYEQAAGLPDDALRPSRDILRDYGNMSSATVLFVLEDYLTRGIARGEYGLMTVFGPGFSAEMALIRG
jgi:alkylresorcinol/alkylpyrone synthase